MPIATESGESSKLFTADAEYPCVRRLRHRRLLTFLWLQGYEAALGSYAHHSLSPQSPAALVYLNFLD
jgi:hypothetical protein